ncbi:hypothetical protein ACGYLO_21740 [Sulfitobacter sp. 1A13353]|uniref:hypothetical protein n=1 Tax=Sulfitobacter sp. 1A13353 TaxID=3368568 RepID=UPI0037471798
MTLNAFPIAVTASLPFAGPGHSALPVIFFEDPDDGQGLLCKEAVEWASQLSSGNLGSVSVGKHVKTLSRFINFYHLYSKNQSLRGIRDQTISIFAYLDFRLTGTVHLSHGHALSPLEWNGCARNTVRAEYRHLARFFSFLEKYVGNETEALDYRLFHLFPNKVLMHSKKNEHDFLQHLASYRKFWADLREDEAQLPQRMRPAHRKIGYRPFPDESEIQSIINAERNPVFKAIWLLQAYGASHRISEVLQIWQDDILPPSYNREFFGSPSDGVPLVLIAHPSESTWVGRANKEKQTRHAFLLRKYGVPPRSMLPASDPLYTGFKSKQVYGLHMTAKTWWLNLDAAALFDSCVQEIQLFHNRHRTSRRHPYFFVNMLARTDNMGGPLKVKRIESAWVAACKRVGILPHLRGRNIHGLRHFTKNYAEQLGMSSSVIQIMRGDVSAASQDDYGRCAFSLHEALAHSQLGHRKN